MKLAGGDLPREKGRDALPRVEPESRGQTKQEQKEAALAGYLEKIVLHEQKLPTRLFRVSFRSFAFSTKAVLSSMAKFRAYVT